LRRLLDCPLAFNDLLLAIPQTSLPFKIVTDSTQTSAFLADQQLKMRAGLSQ
jgi:hypothetical protein